MRQSVSKLLTGVLSGSSSRMQTRAEKQGENGAEYKKDVMFHTDGGLQDKRAVLRLFTFDEAEMLHVPTMNYGSRYGCAVRSHGFGGCRTNSRPGT